LPYSLWQPLPERPFYAAFLPVLSLISFGVLLLVLLNVIHFGVLILVFVINFFIRSSIKKKIDIFIYAFQYLGVLINTAEKLSLLKFNELRDIQENLIKSLKDTKTIAKKIFTLQFKDELGVMEYLNIYFLWDISGFYSAIYKIRQHISELREMYMTIGYLDSMIAIASFRQEYPLYCRPSFNTKMFNVNDLYNPLLTKPVPNSFIFDTNNFLITGSNMSGKTTFLKTTGVNAILAQTIHTVMAESYEAPFLQVISSIGKEDNLLLGKSYYLAEVESILRLLKASESETIHLFILDEIFRGTNSVERLAASIEVLNYLANNKDYVLVATHDLQLSDFLKDNYKNFHFREKVCDEGLTFDYKIHPGISTTRNAIALLKYVGYPQSIVENAFKRINKDE
jgi:DNA mismatch repair ATPase MutS